MNYSFDLLDLPFQALKSGKKRIETRTKVPQNMTPYENMKPGDTIVFEHEITKEKLIMEIVGIRHYKNVAELLDSEGQENVMSYDTSREEAIKSWDKLTGYIEGMRKYGIWAIEVKPLPTQSEEQINLVPYDPTWSTEFEKEKKLIEATIGEWTVGGIHHVGSTAVDGLSAKPIIDIMVGVENLEKAKPLIEKLTKIQYCYFPYKPELMLWFCKPSPYKRTHHLYLMEPSHPEWKARLSFRDYLRNHQEARDEYQDLKERLAEKFKDDREAYTEAKSKFIERIVKEAEINHVR